MLTKRLGPRKRRTKQHVSADQSVHHVEGFILDEGHTAERFSRDYSYDLLMRTYDERGYVEPDRVYFQMKASEHLKEVDGAFFHDLDIRDYHLWMSEQTIVVLVLYDAGSRNAYWIAVKSYFLAAETRPPRKGAKWVRIRIPKTQRMGRQSIVDIRLLKMASSAS
jgi:hypothetical protein